MSNLIDLTGQKFGKWTVLERDLEKQRQLKTNGSYWKCQCECGNIKSVQSSKLRRGESKSCGQCQHNGMPNNFINEIGKKYGYLTVLKIDETSRNSRDGIKWICQCDCGNITSVAGKHLRKKITTSCGCRTGNLIGKQFGEWTILYKSDKKYANIQTQYMCRCNCGTEKLLPVARLLSGNSLSCGCTKVSYGVNEIKEILNDNNIKFEMEKSFPTCIYPKTNYHLKFDLFLPDYNTIIEYDGLQHFQPIKGWGEDNFQNTQEHDNYKNNWCKKNNFILIRIPYSQKNKIKLEDLLPTTSQFLINIEDREED